MTLALAPEEAEEVRPAAPEEYSHASHMRIRLKSFLASGAWTRWRPEEREALERLAREMLEEEG